MRISQSDVVEFAQWSGDCNPIHVDPIAAKMSAFGGTIVHGALSVIVACREARKGRTEPTASLEIEFRGEIRPDSNYTLDLSQSDGGFAVSVGDEHQHKMSVRAELELDAKHENLPSVEWLDSALAGVQSSNDDRPVSWTPGEFAQGKQVDGVHTFGKLTGDSQTLRGSVEEQVLGLCSFIVGMKAPGLTSLFTRLSVEFHSAGQPDEQLAYRLTFRDYDPHFRLLETSLEIASVEGRPIATAEIQSYVRFAQQDPDPTRFVGELASDTTRLAGKTALVCGASRGLGAEIAAALGAAKCHVYLACRNPNDKTKSLAELIGQAGGSAEIVAGDVGDRDWCEATREQIAQQRGALDLLVLNACGAPEPARIDESSADNAGAYLARNVKLWQNPLIQFMPSIADAAGTVIAISTSFVDEAPAGFADYIAVKMAMEGAMKTAAGENRNARFLIARPPKLRTSWNDTPTSAMGAIPTSVAAARIVNVATEQSDKNLAVLTAFPHDEPALTEAPREPDLELVLCSSFTLDPFHGGFEAWSRELDAGVAARFAPYAQILQQSLDPTSELSNSNDGSVILLRVSDWLRELSAERLADAAGTEQWLRDTATEHIEAIKAHRSISAAPTLLLLCPSTPRPEVSDSVIAELEQRFIQALTDVPGLTVQVVREHHDLYEVGEADVFDALREDIAHIPFQDAYYHFLTTLIVRFFHRRLVPPKKVVVLDCDNTLWSGVVGEVGPAGIELHDVHHRLHKRLNRLAESGVLICLCSKNEEHDVWSVFEQRSDFGLSRDQIVAAAVNWLPKSQNILSLAESLNLGLDSFIFLDDNPVECAEVRSGCPSVLTVRWPQEDSAATKLLDHLWELDAHVTTAEDKQRTQRYKEEFRRQQSLSSAANFHDFIDSLNLVIDSQELSDGDIARASQLTMRTNQFNFTTIRRAEVELRELADDPRYACRTIRVSDRFGDYGLVGFYIALIKDDSLQVDSFLLSCRVLGRGVEYEMASELGQIALSHNLPQVRWPHIPTERNTPARLFLQRLSDDSLPDDPALPCEWVSKASELAAVKFQADRHEPAEAAQQPKKQSADKASLKKSPRARETQIDRTVASLSSLMSLALVFDCSPASNPGAEVAEGDIAEHVLAAFAKSLRKPAEEVSQVDRLDLLGCDSLRIVEITVGLTREYPWLPKTLLFEYRAVSEIVDAVVQLARGSREQTGDETVKVAAPPQDQSEIAIVGLGVNCADADSASELWELLANGRSAVRRVPRNRDSFVGPLTDTHDHFVGMVDNAADFDAEFFGISPRESEYLDPQLRILLQNAWRALEDAHAAGAEFDKATGVFVGVMYSGYARFANAVGAQNGSLYRCWEGFSLANRLSQILGCSGPSLSVDTACSSSATALHYACQSLRRGDCASAVVSGVNLIVDPDRLVQFGRLGILSPSGNCVPFGSEADGTVLGEGAVSIVLRPLADAIRRGDRVYAVVKGTGISSGAGSVGFTAPNPTAQSKATRRALVSANVDPRTVTYIETHGTGTELGDPIEVRGLEMAYCDPSIFSAEQQIQHRCTIGSIKPNVGHLEAGAGLMGVVKAALQLHHRTLVPSLTSPDPNPQIPFNDLPFDIQREKAAWEPTRLIADGVEEEIPRRAGVNSFGIGGSNVHVILEEAPLQAAPQETELERPAHLLALSAVNHRALQQQAGPWKSALADRDLAWAANACHSANLGHKHHSARAAVVVSRDESALEALDQVTAGRAVPQGSRPADSDAPTMPRIAFLFTGQGAQYPSMLRGLHQHSPVFREAFDRCADYLRDLLPRPLEEIVFCGEVSDRDHAIHQTGFTQPALFATQYALFQLWKSWGVGCDVMMGHSIGEVAAFCAAGGCSLDDALQLVEARGRLMQALPPGGAMCSVELDRDAVQQALEGKGDRVSIAAMNGPRQTVISGAVEVVEFLAAQFDQQGIQAIRLSVSHAFHSSLMDPMLGEFSGVLERLDLGIPETPVVSSATGEVVHDQMSKPDYWLQQARNPVRFIDAMNTISQQGATHFVELGPHPVLLAMGRQCLPDSEASWVPSARRAREDWITILGSLGRLYVEGVDVDWRGFDEPYQRSRISVPGYEFDQQRTWIAELDSVDGTTRSGKFGQSSAEPSEQLCYHLQWLQSDRSEVHRNGRATNWLVVSEDSGAAREFSHAVSQRGIACSHAGIPLGEASGGAELADLLKAGFERIIYVDRPPQQSTATDDQLLQSNAAKTHHFCRLATALESLSPAPRSLWLVTENAVPTEPSSSLNLASASLLGLARVAALEISDAWGGILDADDWKTQLDQLIDEISNPTDEDQVAFRDTRRLVPRLHTHRLAPRDGSFVNRLGLDDHPIIITGGLGGIGLELADWLTGAGAKHLLLASRSGKPSAAAAALIDGLRARGAQIDVVAADVATPAGVQACLDAAGKPPGGIFHAAGVDLRRPMVESRPDEIHDVMSAKVAGAWLLHEKCDREHLKIFVCFSSIAAVWGSAGRGIYAGANAFLDALVQWRRAERLPALSINFGPWKGAGMADQAALDELARIGNYGLDPKQTCRLIGELIDEDAVSATIANVDWQKFLPILESRRAKPLFADLRRQPESATASDASVNNAYPWVALMRQTPEGERHALLLSELRSEVAGLLRIDDPQSISADRSLFKMGLDSLMSAELTNRLRLLTGVADSTLLLGTPTLQSISSVLLPRLNVSEVPTGTRQKSNATVGRWKDQLARTGAEQQSELMVSLLAGELSTTLGKKGTGKISPTRKLTDLGLDSLGSVEFANRVRDLMELSAAPRVLDYPDLKSLAENLVADLPPPIAPDIVGYSEAIEPAVFQFTREAWPDRRGDWIEPRWKWMFLDSAKRLNVDPKVWLFRDEDRVVGHHGAQLVRFKIGDEERTTAWLVDTMVLKSYRQSGVGTRLVMQSLEDLPFNLSLGQAENMRTILEQLGWKRITALQTYMLALNPGRVLTGKLPMAIAPVASAFIRLRGTTRRLLRSGSADLASIRQINRFDGRHDELWQEVASCYGCSTVRDASYMNWKYVDQPGQSFSRLEISTGDDLIASAVLSIKEPDRVYRYRRVHVIDLVTSTDLRRLHTTIECIIQHCKEWEADAIVMHVINQHIQQALENYDFMRRDPTRYLVIAADDSVDKARLEDPGQWLITQGDSDIDRPW